MNKQLQGIAEIVRIIMSLQTLYLLPISSKCLKILIIDVIFPSSSYTNGKNEDNKISKCQS